MYSWKKSSPCVCVCVCVCVYVCMYVCMYVYMVMTLDHGMASVNKEKKHSTPMVMALVRGMASVTSTSKFGGPTSLWSFWHKPRPWAFFFKLRICLLTLVWGGGKISTRQRSMHREPVKRDRHSVFGHHLVIIASAEPHMWARVV
jgi:hypothetical protein